MPVFAGRTHGVRVWSPFASGGGLWDRLKGPGGFYNFGNTIGLVVGLLLQIRDAGGDGRALTRSVEAYFLGGWAATALTFATIIFFWSGEEYHQAWAGSSADRWRRTRRGDLLSAIGAALLGVGLLLVGDPLLAATAGALHAAGKLGSALSDPTNEARPAALLRHIFRWSVVASRLPAILIALIGIAGLVVDESTADADAAPMLVTLLVCYALWTAADLMLLRPSLCGPSR